MAPVAVGKAGHAVGPDLVLGDVRLDHVLAVADHVGGAGAGEADVRGSGIAPAPHTQQIEADAQDAGGCLGR